jgi:hypothetical protein
VSTIWVKQPEEGKERSKRRTLPDPNSNFAQSPTEPKPESTFKRIPLLPDVWVRDIVCLTRMRIGKSLEGREEDSDGEVAEEFEG